MNQILYWNDVALEANRISNTDGNREQLGPVLAARALAIVHLAMYDAYAGVRGNPTTPINLGPYLPSLPPTPPGASAGAAVAAAGHATLSSLYPSQKAFFEAKHRGAGLSGTGIESGHQFGVQIAQKLLKDRQQDPDISDNGYATSIARGAHRADPDNPNQGVYAPFYGSGSRCFAVTQRHGLAAPPQPGTPEYLRALREVRSKGIAPELMGTLPPGSIARTPEETLIGTFWAYDGAAKIGTPPRLYNQIARAVAIAKGNDEASNARLFALVNAAMADAGILAWEQKYLHNLWRPVLGIREQDTSQGVVGDNSGKGIFSGDCDPNWLPLEAPATNSTQKNFTPNFPAYPSGHATFGAAALQMIRLFYKFAGHNTDTLFQGLTLVSEELNGENLDRNGTVRPRHTRTFPGGLWQMIEENGRSRVYLGVHWVFDAFATDTHGKADLSKNIGGVPLGLKIAEDIFQNGLQRSTVGP